MAAGSETKVEAVFTAASGSTPRRVGIVSAEKVELFWQLDPRGPWRGTILPGLSAPLHRLAALLPEPGAHPVAARGWATDRDGNTWNVRMSTGPAGWELRLECATHGACTPVHWSGREGEVRVAHFQSPHREPLVSMAVLQRGGGAAYYHAPAPVAHAFKAWYNDPRGGGWSDGVILSLVEPGESYPLLPF